LAEEQPMKRDLARRETLIIVTCLMVVV